MGRPRYEDGVGSESHCGEGTPHQGNPSTMLENLAKIVSLRTIAVTHWTIEVACVGKEVGLDGGD